MLQQGKKLKFQWRESAIAQCQDKIREEKLQGKFVKLTQHSLNSYEVVKCVLQVKCNFSLNPVLPRLFFYLLSKKGVASLLFSTFPDLQHSIGTPLYFIKSVFPFLII